VLLEQPPNLERLADEQSEGVDLPVGRYYSRILDENGRTLIETPDMEALPTAMQFPALADNFMDAGVRATHGAVAENVMVQKIPDGRTLMLMTARSKTSQQQTIQIALDISHEAHSLLNTDAILLGAVFWPAVFNVSRHFCCPAGLESCCRNDATYRRYHGYSTG
jgi:two-component system heavy metal sensor histidine kinase CusS